MALRGEAKKLYQREYMRKRRAVRPVLLDPVPEIYMLDPPPIDDIDVRPDKQTLERLPNSPDGRYH